MDKKLFNEAVDDLSDLEAEDNFDENDFDDDDEFGDEWGSLGERGHEEVHNHSAINWMPNDGPWRGYLTTVDGMNMTEYSDMSFGSYDVIKWLKQEEYNAANLNSVVAMFSRIASDGLHVFAGPIPLDQNNAQDFGLIDDFDMGDLVNRYF